MEYPEPLIIEPLLQSHKQTLILLHGRGSSGEKFGPVLLNTPISPPSPDSASVTPPSLAHVHAAPQTLATVFPHARFVFPTAARRRAALYRRAYTHQWFDNWTLDPPATDREHLQIPSLCETTDYLYGLLHKEIALVPGGAASVVLGGLSQGCAASLIAMLLWTGEPLAAIVGMCGRLPFETGLSEQLVGVSDELADAGFDPFDRSDEKTANEGHTEEMDPSRRGH